MGIDIKKHEHLRDTYTKESGEDVEETYAGVHSIEDWEGDAPSWAEWGYVIWLEKQILEIKAIKANEKPAK